MELRYHDIVRFVSLLEVESGMSHCTVNADQSRQLEDQAPGRAGEARTGAADRGRSREQWKQKCETASVRAEQAEVLAQQRLGELAEAHAELAKLKAEKKRSAR